MKYQKGDVVWWWSDVSGQRSKALFVKYDPDFPKEDAHLAIRVGPKRKRAKDPKPFVQVFRWPLRLMEPV